jgi:hypothetical protein
MVLNLLPVKLLHSLHELALCWIEQWSNIATICETREINSVWFLPLRFIYVFVQYYR